MYRHTLRVLVLAGALTALAVPVLNGVHGASACSNPNCVTSETFSGMIDSYVSPIVISSPSAIIAERATSGQTHDITLAGDVDFTVLDARGNNQGWTAHLTANGFSSSLFPLLPIPGSDVVANGTPTVTLTCYGPYSCGAGMGVLATSDFGTPQTVAEGCYAESIGFGAYAVSVPINVNITGLAAEAFGSYPASWDGSFTVDVLEGPPAPC